MDNTTIILNNGIEMPMVGLGTFLIPKENLSRTIAQAYEMGYRKFDTAWRYYNEKEIAKALKENGIPREDVFITTKINADAFYRKKYYEGKHKIFNIRNFRSIDSVIEESFANLDTEYIDMFLVHWPWPMYLKMYRGLTKFYKEGRIRAIGVCSCKPEQIRALEMVSDVLPALNQFEISPLNTQVKLVDWCHENGICPEAMSTFSHFRSNAVRKDIVENDLIRPIAEKYGKSIPQVILRWLNQRGISIIPKTWIVEHLEENINIFDFMLTPEEMQIIDGLDSGRCLNYDMYDPRISWTPRKYRNGFGL